MNLLPGKSRQTERQTARRSVPRTDLGLLTTTIGFNLRLAQDASFRAFARHSGEPHLKPGRYAAMAIIHSTPGIAPGEVGRAIGRDKSTVTPLIQELQRRGLVARETASDDRRRITLRLTAAGEAALKTLRQHAREHDRQLDAIIGEKKTEFVALLKKIVSEID
jgi:DNA-binding MarR family transcriptional regulator